MLDLLQERLTLYADHGLGSLVAASQIPALSGPRRLTVRPIAMGANGNLLAMERWYPPDQRFVEDSGYFLLRAPRLGGTADTVVRLSYGRSWLVVPLPGGNSQLEMRQPWATDDLVAVSPGGHRIFVVRRPTADDSREARYRILAFGETSSPIFVTEVTYRPIPLRDAEVARRAGEIAAQIRDRFPSARAAQSAVTEALNRPAFFPPAAALIAASDGSVWIQREDSSGIRRWDVLDAAGRLALRVHGPATVELREAHGAHAWGVRQRGDEHELVGFRVITR
ncbi:MAG: hypothetical protein ACREMJ_11870 [Gemmatimonadales bacterium]